MVLNLLFVLLIIIGVVFLIWWLVKQFSGGPAWHGPSSRALDTLKERYAKGEISKEEYDRIKKDLGG
jgi:putative membrane protein